MSNEVGTKTRQYQQQLDNLTRDYEKRRKDLVKQQDQDIANIRKSHEDKVQQTKVENEAAVVDIQSQGQERIEQLQREQERRVDNLSSTADSRVREKEHSTQAQLDKLKAYQEGELARKQRQHEARSHDMSNQYNKKFRDNADLYSRALKRQHQRFTDNFQHTEQDQLESLNVTKSTYAKALADQKREFLVKQSDYDSVKDDPFYRIQDHDSSLHDTLYDYVLRVRIPEHEAKNIKVRIQSDKVTISGTRSFQDKLQDDNKTTSTNNYQTFREEIKLDLPASTRGVREERDGDMVTYTIPKLLYLNQEQGEKKKG